MNHFDDPEKLMMQLRPADEVAARCIILCCVVAHAEDPSLTFDDWLQHENLWPLVSPKEKRFLLDITPSEREVRNASWRQEALLILMWSLQKLKELPPPIQTQSFAEMLEQMPEPESNTSLFVGTAKLRPIEQIIPTYEQIYQQHWAVRAARINGNPQSPGLEQGVIYERHYALNWLRRYGIFEEQEWDEITTDT